MTSLKKNLLSLLLLSLFSLLILVNVVPAQADQGLVDHQVGLNAIGTTAYNSKVPTDVRITVMRILTVVLNFLGIIFFGLTIFAGFKYMTAAGNEDKAKESLDMIRNAIIGLLIVLMAWAITRYVVTIMSQAAGNAVDYTAYPKI
jgi:TRAP-type C4-dicarboxylate transport system permease small subunit